MIVPIRRDAKRPCAIAPSASIPYLFPEISISLRFKNCLNLFMMCFPFAFVVFGCQNELF